MHFFVSIKQTTLKFWRFSVFIDAVRLNPATCRTTNVEIIAQAKDSLKHAPDRDRRRARHQKSLKSNLDVCEIILAIKTNYSNYIIINHYL